MANDQESFGYELALPSILAVLLVILAAWLLWVTQVRMPQEQAAAEQATAEAIAEEAGGALPEAPAEAAVDIDLVIATVNKGGCGACHVIPGVPNAAGQVGPNLSNIGADGANRRDGYSAADYIHESIVEPVAFTAPDCPTGPCITGTMPVVQLEEAEVDILVSYLTSLGGAEAVEVSETTEDSPEAAPEPIEFTSVALEPIVEPAAPATFVSAFNKAGCAGCHTIPGIPGANGQVGPSLAEIGIQAPDRVAGQSGEDYLRESILDPNAFISPACPTGDCPENVMLQSFAQSLSEADLESIVSYLSVLGTADAVELALPSAGLASIDVTLPPESVLEPFIPLPQAPPSEAQITLGKHLFFDPRLSNNNSLSCASCHQPDRAFADAEALSQGYPSTKYFRNVPSLFNTAYSTFLYRDGRMDGTDMPTLVRDHLTEAHFMSNDGRLMAERLKQVPAYVELFNEAYGSDPGFGSTLRAIAAYVQTLNSPPTPYDRFLAGETGALSEEAQAGLALFEGEAQCSSCHNGDLLSDGNFYNTGVPTDDNIFEDPERHVTFRRFFRTLGTPNYRNLREDVGLYALTKDEADWGKFYTPGLREVGRTAPYMHNGSLVTLEDVVRFYSVGGGPNQTAELQPLRLSNAEGDQLVAFLESLSSEPIPVEAPSLPDYQLLTLGGSE
jgi:cytochrome c peroxidase